MKIEKLNGSDWYIIKYQGRSIIDQSRSEGISRMLLLILNK